MYHVESCFIEYAFIQSHFNESLPLIIAPQLGINPIMPSYGDHFWSCCFAQSMQPTQTEQTQSEPELRPPQNMGERVVPAPKQGSAWVYSDWKFVLDIQGIHT